MKPKLDIRFRSQLDAFRHNQPAGSATFQFFSGILQAAAEVIQLNGNPFWSETFRENMAESMPALSTEKIKKKLYPRLLLFNF